MDRNSSQLCRRGSSNGSNAPSSGASQAPRYPPAQHVPSVRGPVPPPRQGLSARPAPSSAAAAHAGVPLGLDAPIPRQNKSRPPPLHPPTEEPQRRVILKCERPFLLQVKMRGVPSANGGIPRHTRVPHEAEITTSLSAEGARSSGRKPQKRKSYAEDLEDTDSDVSEADDGGASKKRVKKKRDADQPVTTNDLTTETHLDDVDEDFPQAQRALIGDANASELASSDPFQIDAPPNGVLPSLWYSRESVLHVFVIEKILGWKTRPTVVLERSMSLSDQEGAKKQPALDAVTAKRLSDKAIDENMSLPRKRMEISRINIANCPLVIKAAGVKEQLEARKNNTSPQLEAVTSQTDREEVLLIKWRGRSYLHCSWERKRDLEKFDTTNNTARGKIKRYFLSQETMLGKNWKKVLEEGRAIRSAQGHAPTGTTHLSIQVNTDDPTEEEDFFPPDYIEVERILACDEADMDISVLARQRAYNLKADRDAAMRRDEAAMSDRKDAGTLTNGVTCEIVSKTVNKSTEDITVGGEGNDESWDPEDNVRYVVKWKGLQVADVTWEYWKDIKYDSVDQAEDFWTRQRAPDPEAVKAIVEKPHPHMRDYKKLTVSPVFGTSTAKRPVADIYDDNSTRHSDEDEEGSEQSAGLQLRSYQLEGVSWLLWNWWNRRSCILADEMGLGKTIQTMCFLSELYSRPTTEVRGPFLIVAPLSLVAQWNSESTTWAPDMNVLLYHGSADAREFLVHQEFYYLDQFIPKTTAAKLKRQHITKFNILITTYEVVLKDIAVLSKIKWKALIVDEAHRLKNSQSRLFADLATVPREFCLLLTGTPLQNSTEELWALLHFCDPVAFASRDAFVDKFGQLTDAQQVSELHTLLKPYLLRRVKEDVEKSLPPKEETILEVALTPTQKTFYKAIYERNTAFLFKGSKPSNAPSLMNVMMELRKCCNHPFLIRGAEERILTDAAAVEKKADGSVVDWQTLVAEHLVKASGKMVLLAKLLPKLQDGGHKVLIFSQMVRVLDLLEELLRLKHYRYERLDGSTGASARAGAIDRFNRKSCHRFVMLLSTRAGGLGLNLTSADTVIIFDSDWNPQNDLQAMARAHRIGQTRAVRVYRLLTAKTYEMHMFHSASMKLGLDRAVLAHQRQQGGEDDDDPAKKVTKSKSEKELQAKEIDELLRKGAYDVFRDEDDTDANKFMETDIDQLLERSSRTVTYGNTNETTSAGLGSFSKASFVTADADGKDIDLDDPDFWEKAVGLEAPVESTLDENMLLEGEKRSRKQVQVFDPYAAFAEAEQKKKDKIAQKIREEKEERERLRLKKRKKKDVEKEERRREREETRDDKDKVFGLTPLLKREYDETEATEDKKYSKEGKAKKIRKAERRRAARKAEREGPVLERIKQGWEVAQRNRASQAILRYGFGRFCKIRNEANLTSVPIQDIEVFVRAYVFQLGMQASFSMLAESRQLTQFDDIEHSNSLFNFLRALVSAFGNKEGQWIANAISAALNLNTEVLQRKRSVRMPLSLTDPAFVSELRTGGAVRSLRNLAFLSRLNGVIEDSLDHVLTDLGHEELGKRGCPTKDLTMLDVDLKARHVTTEELSQTIGNLLDDSIARNEEVYSRSLLSNPAPWWDRSCDLALLIGTFVHGLGRYEAMRNDEDLPFASKISGFVALEPASVQAFKNFQSATTAVRNAFDNAFNSAKAKAQAEAHAAVSAAVAALKVTELLGHQVDDDVSSIATTPFATLVSPELLHTDESSSSDVAKTSSSHIVTLLSISECLRQSMQSNSDSPPNGDSNKEASIPMHQRLPMPDAKNLDRRVLELVDIIEDNSTPAVSCNGPESNHRDENGNCNLAASKRWLKLFGLQNSDSLIVSTPFVGRNYRNLEDGSDYQYSAASTELSAIATGAEASRYQRGPGVPILLTRYGVCALFYADHFALIGVTEIEQKAMEYRKRKCEDLDNTHVNSMNAVLPDTTGSFQSDHDAFAVDVYSVNVFLPTLRDSTSHRAGICAALLYAGWPLTANGGFSRELRITLGDFGINTVHSDFFSISDLMLVAENITGMQYSLTARDLVLYIRRVLIPHCLRVCLNAGYHSPNVVPFDFGHRKERPNAHQIQKIEIENEFSFLPDPLLPVHKHSDAAVGNACAILRRVRLIRAIRHVLGGSISANCLLSFFRGPAMRKGISGVPVWWCPWIHDVALLMYAAQYGLFAIIGDRQDVQKLRSNTFALSSIKNHVRTLFVEGMDDQKPLLPRFFLDKASVEEIDTIVQTSALQFPSGYVIERRLAFACAELLRSESMTNSDCNSLSFNYVDIPMFDHGSWPKEDKIID